MAWYPEIPGRRNSKLDDSCCEGHSPRKVTVHRTLRHLAKNYLRQEVRDLAEGK